MLAAIGNEDGKIARQITPRQNKNMDADEILLTSRLIFRRSCRRGLEREFVQADLLRDELFISFRSVTRNEENAVNMRLRFRFDHDVMWISNLQVSPAFRWQGRGRELVGTAETIARSLGICKIQLFPPLVGTFILAQNGLWSTGRNRSCYGKNGSFLRHSGTWHRRTLKEIGFSMSIRVLVADPDEALLVEYRKSLSSHQFMVLTATNGSDCLKMLRADLPHVLVLEPDLPSEQAKLLIDLIRDSPHVPTVPVIVVSHLGREQSPIPIRFSIWSFHTKPIAIDELAQEIHTAAQEGPVNQ